AERQNELRFNLQRLGRLKEQFQVEGVIKIRRDSRDVQLARGPLLDARRDAARKVRQQVRVRVERFQFFLREADDGKRGFRWRWATSDVRDLHFRSGHHVRPVNSRIEPAHKVWAGLTFLGGKFENGFVVERGLL